MTYYVSGFIECFIHDHVLKYEFTVDSSKIERLITDYIEATCSLVPLRLECGGGDDASVVIISGDLIQHSTLHCKTI